MLLHASAATATIKSAGDARSRATYRGDRAFFRRFPRRSPRARRVGVVARGIPFVDAEGRLRFKEIYGTVAARCCNGTLL